MFKIVKGISSFIKGGWYALIGTAGGFVGEAIADVWKQVLDYAWFDDENGYLKDYPDRKNESLGKRLWRIYHD